MTKRSAAVETHLRHPPTTPRLPAIPIRRRGMPRAQRQQLRFRLDVVRPIPDAYEHGVPRYGATQMPKMIQKSSQQQ